MEAQKIAVDAIVALTDCDRDAVTAFIRRLYLAGVAYDGVGIPDCVHAAEMTADSLLDALANPAASAA